MTPQKAYETACSSKKFCEQFGITGRVFANRQQALAITEGPRPILDYHLQAVQDDPLVETVLLHVDREIVLKEFPDFSLWLNLGKDVLLSDGIFQLTSEAVKLALPANPSPKLRIMAEAYLFDSMMEVG